MLSRKRRRAAPPSIHPRNRYSEHPPDFALLASLYPSFQPFVSTSRSGRPTIDWTDFNATRQLTRILLLHDHSVNWWIPDGQLSPTVPNRSNYIHWIQDLLSSELVPASNGSEGRVRGFDIGTGANCIYPLLGASVFGWNFVGSDVTAVALEWARKNVESNPQLAELIEIRDARGALCSGDVRSRSEELPAAGKVNIDPTEGSRGAPRVLVDVVRDGEHFDFCMCNPPFFESIEEAGMNPKTACGGTHEEMVYPGGELAFITRIIEDSVSLKHSFRWFTSMVGRKVNLKLLVSKLREVRVSVVKTTEFVQGHTARWGLAWSFISPSKRSIALSAPKRNNFSFTLEGLQRQSGAIQVLKSVESFFLASGARCKLEFQSFCVNVILSSKQAYEIPNDEPDDLSTRAICTVSNDSDNSQGDELSCCISVFEQIPGTLLVRGSLLHKESPLSGVFSSLFEQLEEDTKKEFLKSHGSRRT